MRLSAEPILSIGRLDGPDEYLFAGINAGARLADGSVVVSDRQQHRVQRFSAEGEHLWSRGREGEGPGEFRYVRIAEGCASEEAIVVYDIWTDRVYVYDGNGDLLNEYRFQYNGLPLSDFGCAPGGRLGFTGSSVRMGEESLEPGDLYRELVSLGSAELGDTATTTLRERIPGGEQGYLGPGDAMPGSIWYHDVLFATTDEGVWLGTTDDYEVELIDWTGETIRRIRWEGPDLAVTPQDIDRYRDALEERYRDDDDPNWRARSEHHWESEIDYEVELIDWTGATIRRGGPIRWEGPDLAVTWMFRVRIGRPIPGRPRGIATDGTDDDDPNWRARFESTWDWESEIVPDVFPAYERLLVGDDGMLCVHDYTRPGDRSEWFAFDAEGRWIRSLVLPPRTRLLDIGPDWALVRTVDDMDVQRVQVRGLVEGGRGLRRPIPARNAVCPPFRDKSGRQRDVSAESWDEDHIRSTWIQNVTRNN